MVRSVLIAACSLALCAIRDATTSIRTATETIVLASAAFVGSLFTYAFPAAPVLAPEPATAPAPVLGLAAARSFAASLLQRVGDGRERSPLSAAFVT